MKTDTFYAMKLIFNKITLPSNELFNIVQNPISGEYAKRNFQKDTKKQG